MEEEKCLAPFLLPLLLLLLVPPPTSPPAHPSQHGKWTAASASVSILFPTIAVWPDIFLPSITTHKEVVGVSLPLQIAVQIHFKRIKKTTIWGILVYLVNTCYHRVRQRQGKM